MEEHVVYLQSCMYQYSRAIYRSIKDLIDPYTISRPELESRRTVLEECELTMSRLAADPQYFARPDRALFQDIRRYFPITAQAQVAWAVREGVGAAIAFIEQQIEAGAFDGGIARCKATTRKGKACQRTPLPEPRLLPVAPASRSAHVARRLAHRGDGVASANPATPAALDCGSPRFASGKLAHTMSHDTDKLIRQLSLVAFLMAERRPLTARDVKGNVEGYSEMSDEAFARRFYSDRAELTGARRAAPLAARRVHRRGALHPPLGELLPRPPRPQGRRARGAPDGAVLPRRQVRLRRAAAARATEPRARPARLPRGPHRHRRAGPGQRSRLLARARRAALEARVGDLEAAHDQVRVLVASAGQGRRERTLNPYALRLDEGIWYVVGQDLDRAAVRTFRVSRIRSDIRFATRRERDFRLPPDFDVEAHRVPRPWQIGEIVGHGPDRACRATPPGGCTGRSPTPAR